MEQPSTIHRSAASIGCARYVAGLHYGLPACPSDPAGRRNLSGRGSRVSERLTCRPVKDVGAVGDVAVVGLNPRRVERRTEVVQPGVVANEVAAGVRRRPHVE